MCESESARARERARARASERTRASSERVREKAHAHAHAHSHAHAHAHAHAHDTHTFRGGHTICSSASGAQGLARTSRPHDGLHAARATPAGAYSNGSIRSADAGTSVGRACWCVCVCERERDRETLARVLGVPAGDSPLFFGPGLMPHVSRVPVKLRVYEALSSSLMLVSRSPLLLNASSMRRCWRTCVVCGVLHLASTSYGTRMSCLSRVMSAT
jgi:hypothetical protein